MSLFDTQIESEPVNYRDTAATLAHWMIALEQIETPNQIIKFYLKESAIFLQSELVLYMEYSDFKKALVVKYANGANIKQLENVGIDLSLEEPGFQQQQLYHPQQMNSLKTFVKKGLGQTEALILPFQRNGIVLGVFILTYPLSNQLSDIISKKTLLEVCLRIVEKQNNYFEQDILIKKINKIDLSSGVGNSEYCLQKVHDEISRSRRTLQPVTLLLISLDNYYDLRLRHSNVAISYFIRSIADFLVAKSRVNDVVGRWKDDEFILCLPHTNLRGAAVKAEKLRRLIETLDFSQIYGTATIITTSIGVSEYPKHCRDAQELIDRAEIALIEVKKQGKNKILLSAAQPNFEPDFTINER